MLGTGNFIGYLAMAIIAGFIAARFATRIVITFALILMGISMILTGPDESFGFAFSMRLLPGLGNGAAFMSLQWPSDRPGLPQIAEDLPLDRPSEDIWPI